MSNCQKRFSLFWLEKECYDIEIEFAELHYDVTESRSTRVFIRIVKGKCCMQRAACRIYLDLKAEVFMRLLIAEQEQGTLKQVLQALQMNHYEVDVVQSGKALIQYMETGVYDGVVMDSLLKDMNGITVIQNLRGKGYGTPLLLISSDKNPESVAASLDAGADDYLEKPFFTEVFLARVRAMLRRKEMYTPDTLKLGDLTLESRTYCLHCGDSVAMLSRKEFQIMELFMRNPGHRFSAEQILSHGWGWEKSVDTSVVWVHMSNLRKKFKKIGTEMKIQSYRHSGYTLENSIITKT